MGKEDLQIIATMKATKVTPLRFMSQAARSVYEKDLARIDFALSQLRAKVEANGESWGDVLEYSKRGADYKKEARLAECRAFMDAQGFPRYMRGDMERKAVEDLGEASLTYWAELAPLLRLPIPSNFPDFDITKDVKDWAVTDGYKAKVMESGLVTMEAWQVEDLHRFTEALNTIADLVRKGYDYTAVTDAVGHYAQMKNVDLDPWWWWNAYRSENDCRVKQ